MKNIKKILFTIIVLIIVIAFPTALYAHSGRTDSNGGHRDNKNKSGLGSYHYHCGGHPAHLHKNGVCPYAPRDQITIKNYKSTMNIGDSQKIEYDISSNKSPTEATISSSDNNIISINDNQLNAKGIGIATITISTKTAKKSFSVTVKEVFANCLDISIPDTRLQIGKNIKISSKILPYNTTNKTITYNSLDDTIATVNSNGEITGISTGVTRIKATTSNNISKDIEIEIFEVVPNKINCIDKIELNVGESLELQATILPENANNKSFTIKSENDNILICSNMILQAVGEGTTSIFVETWNGIQKEIPININIIPATQINIIDITDYLFFNIINKDDEIKLSYEILPENTTYKNIKWVSSNTNIVTVQDDRFVINKTGKVKLTCICNNEITSSVEILIIDDKIIIISIIIISGSILGCMLLFIKYKNKVVIKKQH